jgi:hypothetical protein
MNKDRRDPQSDPPADDSLIDACLDEVLGNHAPPDLSARILRAIEQRHGAVLPPQPAPASRAQWIAVPPAVTERSPPLDPRASRKRVPRWLAASLAACVVVGISLAAAAVLREFRHHHNERPLAHSPAGSDGEGARAPKETVAEQDENPAAPSPGLAAGGAGAAESPEITPPHVAEATAPRGFEQPPPFAVQEQEGSSGGSSHPEDRAYARVKPKPDADADVAAFIASALGERWQGAGVSPSPRAADGEWARRTYLRVLGRIPTYEELTAFLADSSSTKREELLNTLLYDDEYVEQYARHWSGVWANLLIGRSGGTEPDGLANRAGLEQYLRRSLQFNKPYDQMVFELVSATGANRPGAEEYNGAVNFVLGNYTHNHTLATSKTARVFLGKQLHCAQCHNHPFESWTQDDYWALNAFFRQATVVHDADQVRLANRDFPGESGDMEKAEIYFDRLNGLRKVAYPRYLDGTEIDPHGQVAQVDRRRELAHFLGESRDLSRALVNRLWAHFLGYGFVEPVDDMRPGNPPTHPELLEYLSDQVIAHGHDVKRLVRWIALSEPFALSSRITPQNAADAPENGAAPLFSRYYTRQMDAEAMYDSLALLAAGGDRSSQVFAELQGGRRAWLGQFTLDLETDEGDEANMFNGAVPQSLAMMNGEIVQATLVSEHGFLHRVIHSEARPADKLDRLFLGALARKPVRREIEAANRLLAERQGDVSGVLEDLWWALLNSNEFILDH